MNKTPYNLNKKGRIVQLYAILSLIFIIAVSVFIIKEKPLIVFKGFNLASTFAPEQTSGGISKVIIGNTTYEIYKNQTTNQFTYAKEITTSQDGVSKTASYQDEININRILNVAVNFYIQSSDLRSAFYYCKEITNFEQVKYCFIKDTSGSISTIIASGAAASSPGTVSYWLLSDDQKIALLEKIELTRIVNSCPVSNFQTINGVKYCIVKNDYGEPIYIISIKQEINANIYTKISGDEMKRILDQAQTQTPPNEDLSAIFNSCADKKTLDNAYYCVVKDPSGNISFLISPITANGTVTYKKIIGEEMNQVLLAIASKQCTLNKTVDGVEYCITKSSSGVVTSIISITTSSTGKVYTKILTDNFAATMELIAKSETSTANTILPFDYTKAYTINNEIIPYVLSTQNVSITNVSDRVFIKVRCPGDKRALVFGNSSSWLANKIVNDNNLFTKAAGSDECSYYLDPVTLGNGAYRVRSAYYDYTKKDWVLSNTRFFNIVDGEEIKTITTTTATNTTITTTKPPLSPEVIVPEVETPIETRTQPTTVVPTQTVTTSAEPEKPIRIAPRLSLFVGNRPITDIKHAFDSETLELRVVTKYPSRRASFFAYRTDRKEEIITLGWGAKEPNFDKNGETTWTANKLMSELPTGDYMVFAEIIYEDDPVNQSNGHESQFIKIAVRRLNQLSNNGDTTSNKTATASRESILERVTNPNGCQNRAECEVFCSSTDSAKEKCIKFARTKDTTSEKEVMEEIKKNQDIVINNISSILPDIINRIEGVATTSSTTILAASPEYSGRPSIVDVIPNVILEKIISNKEKFPPDLPVEVKTVSDLQHYCGVVEHEESCIKTAHNIVPEIKDTVEKQAEIVRTSEDKAKNIIVQRSGARIYVDSDNDGITDFDEVNIYNTDPIKRDTDGDGFSDGATLLGQMNLVNREVVVSATASMLLLGDSITVENPKITGVTHPEIFKVVDIKAEEVKEDDTGKTDVAKIALSGIALPNSFVKIYLFSDPIVVTVKADDSGNWSYTLDKTLPDGTHTAYVAMTDGGGRILAKSEPLPFVKEAAAITVADKSKGLSSSGQKTIMGLSPLTLVAMLVGILGLALSVVGVVIGFRDKKNGIDDVKIIS